MRGVRLQAEGPPDPGDRRLRQSRLGGHRPGRPVAVLAGPLSMSIRVTSASTWSSVIVRAAPGRGASASAPIRPSVNRTRYLWTVYADWLHVHNVAVACSSASNSEDANHQTSEVMRQERRQAYTRFLFVKNRWALLSLYTFDAV